MSHPDHRRRSYGRHADHEDDEDVDNAERFRSRIREKERNHRLEDDYNNANLEGTDEVEQVEAGSGHNRHHRHGTSTSAASPSRDFATEREKRMALLRQQLKEEDEDLAALDQSSGDAARQPLPKPQEEIIKVNQEELDGMDEEEQMKRLLGFDGFGSTKGQAVEDNHSSAARGVAAKNKARKYRQYMNRKNGFNRPLEKMN